MTNEADVSGYGGEAYAGNDEIRTGTGHDIIAGEAFTFLSGNATANSSATATAGEEGFGLAMAGNDLLVADKGDTAALFGNDSVAGEALLGRSEEHKSELQSLMRISYAVFCLKKKK